jgi:hypothetical protein
MFSISCWWEGNCDGVVVMRKWLVSRVFSTMGVHQEGGFEERTENTLRKTFYIKPNKA